jgi:Na+/melibiose symporter-like transporter
LALLCLGLPLLVARGRQSQSTSPASIINFRLSFLTTLRSRVFLIFATCWSLYLMTSVFVQSSIPFIATEICQLSQSGTVYLYIPAILASLACYPLVTRLSDYFGKWRVLAGSFLASAIIFPGTMLIGAWLPISLKAQCVSWAILQAVAVSGATVLGTTFVAEIADRQANATGQHQEGMYYAVMRVLDQVLSGLASLLLPLLFLLGRSRSAPQGPLGIRLVGVTAGLLVFIAFLLFMRYPRRLPQENPEKIA